MEEKETAAQETEETTDAFLNGWDGADAATGTAEEESAEPVTEIPGAPQYGTGDRPETGEEEEKKETPADGTAAPEEAAATAEEEPESEKEPKTWNLRHLDEERAVTETELTALAQKGLDYDRIRERYDRGKPAMEMLNWSAKQNCMSPEAYMAHIRTEAKRAAGMDGETAKREVELEDGEAFAAARQAEAAETARANAAEKWRRADIEEFQRAFPEAVRNMAGIPKEVWDGVRSGQRLTVAYALWQAGQARTEAEAARREAGDWERNARNAARSTGSLRSAGNENRAGDPFLDGFRA